MVKKETRKFVRKNRQLLRDVAERGHPSVRRLATAFLVAVPPEDKEITSSEEETPAESSEDSDGLSEILAGEGER